MNLSGWGRFPTHQAHVSAPRSESALLQHVLAANLIARGNGRSYGDSAISESNTVHMRHFDRLIAFNAETGQVVAEAGVILADVIDSFLPLGWFPAVTPGTRFVTLGGMIAADVHGKNHHRDGSFGNFVDWIDVMTADGTVQHCSRQDTPDLFAWTVGGMGLTGVILRAAFRLRRVETGWIRQSTLPAANLEAAIALMDQSDDATYSVAWIDCLSKDSSLGRGIVMLGEHAVPTDLPMHKRENPYPTGRKRAKSVPFDLPSGLLGPMTARASNSVYYWKNSRISSPTLVSWDSFFYPLDAVLGWNRVYGRKGFAQFQCVIPLDQSRPGLQALLGATSKAGAGCFLAVLKRFGPQQSRFSFPQEGYTLAMDFPVNRQTLSLMNQLDQIVLSHGGRFYLAKDSRMAAETLHRSDSRAEHFLQMRREGNLRPVFSSAQSERLGL